MELRDKLKWGDVPVLAQMAGVSRETAKKTVQGSRRNPKVLEAARLMLESREQIEKKLKQD